MINRRGVCRSIAALAATASFPASRDDALARENCQLTGYGNVCRAEVNYDSFSEMYSSQEESQWCWAACVSMIFSYYGFSVAQERIVEEVYGGRVNLPAMTGSTITQMVNRSWRDDDDSPFSSRVTGIYDAMERRVSIDNNLIIRELRAERPLILGARTHAMVLTAIDYTPTPQGPYVGGAGVFDPWPGVGARSLALDELRPVHLGGSIIYMVSMRVR